MELDGKFGKQLLSGHHEQAAERIQAQKVVDKATEVQQRAKQEKDAEIERLNRPYNLVKKLLETKGVEWGSQPMSELLVEESFRLKDSSDGINMYLKIKYRTVGDEVSVYNTFNLSLGMSSPEGFSEQYLTTISKPSIRHHYGLPEDYGMRTFSNGEKIYEISSYVPNEEDAGWIAKAICEAAEIAGVYNPAEDAHLVSN